jgi:hypothetical protein
MKVTSHSIKRMHYVVPYMIIAILFIWNPHPIPTKYSTLSALLHILIYLLLMVYPFWAMGKIISVGTEPEETPKQTMNPLKTTYFMRYYGQKVCYDKVHEMLFPVSSAMLNALDNCVLHLRLTTELTDEELQNIGQAIGLHQVDIERQTNQIKLTCDSYTIYLHNDGVVETYKHGHIYQDSDVLILQNTLIALGIITMYIYINNTKRPIKTLYPDDIRKLGWAITKEEEYEF